MAIVVVVHALRADLDGAGLAEVLNHLMRMLRTGYALEIAKQQWHGFFTLYEVYYFGIFPALLSRALNNRLVIIRALSLLLLGDHVVDAVSAEGAPALAEDGGHALL